MRTTVLLGLVGLLLLGITRQSAAIALSTRRSETTAERGPFRTNSKARTDAFYKNYDWQRSHAHCIIGAGFQSTCGTCWSWASSRAYAERLCQQSFYAVRVWPSPFITENCYKWDAENFVTEDEIEGTEVSTRKVDDYVNVKRFGGGIITHINSDGTYLINFEEKDDNDDYKVCDGGYASKFFGSMQFQGSLPMSLYPGPPDYYHISKLLKADHQLKDCQWETTDQNRNARQSFEKLKKCGNEYDDPCPPAVKGSSWMDIVGHSLQNVKAPAYGESRTKFTKQLQNELSQHGPVVLSLEEPSCATKKNCKRHAVVLHGWETDKTGMLSWVVKNSYGSSFHRVIASFDKTGRSRYPERDIITTTDFPGGMVVDSYTSFKPDVDKYLSLVKLGAECKEDLIHNDDVKTSDDLTWKAALPDCTLLKPLAAQTECMRKVWKVHTCTVKVTVPEIKYIRYTGETKGETKGETEDETQGVFSYAETKDSTTRDEGSLTLRVRLVPPKGYCAVAVDGAKVSKERTECSKKKTRAACVKNLAGAGLFSRSRITDCSWHEGKFGDGAVKQVLHDFKPNNFDIVKTYPRNVMNMKRQIFLPAFNHEYGRVQLGPLEYVTLELLGWAFESYNKSPIFANGEGSRDGGAVFATQDVFFGEKYTDVNHACDFANPVTDYCDAGKDRACVRALGRYLDRHSFEAHHSFEASVAEQCVTKNESPRQSCELYTNKIKCNAAGSNCKWEKVKQIFTIETLHASSSVGRPATPARACLQFDDGSGNENACFRLDGARVTAISSATCTGFRISSTTSKELVSSETPELSRAECIREFCDGADVGTKQDWKTSCWNKKVRKVHPDKGGSDDDFKKLKACDNLIKNDISLITSEPLMIEDGSDLRGGGETTLAQNETWEVCENGPEVRAKENQRMVCLAVRWAKLKVVFADREEANDGGGGKS